MDTRSARCNCGEYHVGGRQWHVISVMLTDPEEVDAHLVGQYTLFYEVPDRLCVG
jgi:hypothetical protein